MKSFTTLKNDMKYVKEADKWFPVDNNHKFEVGDEVRTPDGLVKVIEVSGDNTKFYGEILIPIHDDVSKGEKYEYGNHETTILAKLGDRRSAGKYNDVSSQHKKGQKVKQKIDKDDDLLMIDDADARHKSPAKYNPIIINPVLEILSGVMNTREIKDLTEINGNKIHEGSLSQSMIRGIALAVKRKAITLGKKAQSEKDLEKKLDLISRQVSATASLSLLAVSVSGDGILSKAGIVSGLFSG
jgi:hypothetical protein